MPDDVILSWLLRPLPIWMMLFLGAVPAAIAHASRRPITPWCIYGFGCALVAWPLVALPTLHALLTRPRPKSSSTSEQDRERQRRADALALLREPSVRSYPSHVTELRRTSPSGVNRRRYVYGFIKPGDVLELVREPDRPRHRRPVAYMHRGAHLGYIPKRQRWVADALDDGLRLTCIVEQVKMSWFSERRARSVVTRIVVLYDGR